jgi:hypothetical protein
MVVLRRRMGAQGFLMPRAEVGVSEEHTRVVARHRTRRFAPGPAQKLIGDLQVRVARSGTAPTRCHSVDSGVGPSPTSPYERMAFLW